MMLYLGSVTTGIACLVLTVLTANMVWAEDIDENRAHIQKGLVGVQLRERGALLMEGFDADAIDEEMWRIWITNPGQAETYTKDGRLYVDGKGTLSHNGLWQKVTYKYKDVVLIGRMDIRSNGPDPHYCLLHLCGGDMPRSPDNWIEVAMVDHGDTAEFFPLIATGEPSHNTRAMTVTAPHKGDDGFMAKLELDAGTNLCTAFVSVDDEWKPVMPPTPLPLRTVHCEVKIRREAFEGNDSPTESQAWFDNVRIYPRPETHPVLFRLSNKEGYSPWFVGDEGWPPTIQIQGEKKRMPANLAVELWTADGKTMVSRTTNRFMGHFLLPLDKTPWHAYPVSARVRLTMDGKPLGDDAIIELNGLEGMYPDDVWDLIVE